VGCSFVWAEAIHETWQLTRTPSLLADRVRELDTGSYDSADLSDSLSDGMGVEEERKPQVPKKLAASGVVPTPKPVSFPPQSYSVPTPTSAVQTHQTYAPTPQPLMAPPQHYAVSTPVAAIATPRNEPASPQPDSAPASAKGKKSAAKPREPRASKPKKAQLVARDAQNKPTLPARVGVFTIHSLGNVVVDRDAYHTDRYVYPVGYRVSRTYPSTVDPNATVENFCSIEDGGDTPLFRVEPSDAPQNASVASSATGAWTAIAKVANAIRNKETSSSSGIDNFGFTNATIQSLVQELPGVESLKKFEPQVYEIAAPKGPSKRGAKKAKEEESLGEEEEDELVGASGED